MIPDTDTVLKDLQERTQRIRDETDEILSELEEVRKRGPEDGRSST